jgi:hypothetical protein
VLKKLNQLIEQNNKLAQQNRELMAQIESLRRILNQQAGAVTDTVQQQGDPTTSAITLGATERADNAPTVADSALNAPMPNARLGGTQTPDSKKGDQQEPQTEPNAASGKEYGRNTAWNLYEPGRGFDVAKTDYASLNISG